MRHSFTTAAQRALILCRAASMRRKQACPVGMAASARDQRARLLGRLHAAPARPAAGRPASRLSRRRSGSASSSISPASTSAAIATSSRGSSPTWWISWSVWTANSRSTRPPGAELDVERPGRRLVARHVGAHLGGVGADLRPGRAAGAGSSPISAASLRARRRRAGQRPGAAQRHMLPGPGLARAGRRRTPSRLTASMPCAPCGRSRVSTS